MRKLLFTLIALIGFATNAQVGYTEQQISDLYENDEYVTEYLVSENSKGTKYIKVKGGIMWMGNMPKPVKTITYFFFEEGSSVVTREKQYMAPDLNSSMSKSYANIYYAFIVEFFMSKDDVTFIDSWYHSGTEGRSVKLMNSYGDIVQIELKGKEDGRFETIIWTFVENIPDPDNPFGE